MAETAELSRRRPRPSCPDVVGGAAAAAAAAVLAAAAAGGGEKDSAAGGGGQAAAAAAEQEQEEGKVAGGARSPRGPEHGLSPPPPGSRCRRVVGAAAPADPKRWGLREMARERRRQ